MGHDKINKLSDFISVLESLNISDKFLFRGQLRATWPLLPKIARIMNGDCTVDKEQEILNTFIKNSYPLINNKPASILGWLAIAQHHGLPTRLLDWSLNPLVALWFAVSGNTPTNEYAIVWVYKPPEDTVINLKNNSEEPNPFKIDRTYVYFPRHEDLRIRAQTGVFTIHFRKNRDEHFPPFEETIINSEILTKLLIPSQAINKIRKSLMHCGVHSASLMPDLDGLCAYISSEYK